MRIKVLAMAMANLLVLSCQQEEFNVPVTDCFIDYGVRLWKLQMEHILWKPQRIHEAM